MAQSTIQKLKIEKDRFSFGTSVKETIVILLIVISVILGFGGLVYEENPTITYGCLIVIFVALLALTKCFITLIKSCSWVPSWIVDAEGIYIIDLYTERKTFFPWSQIKEIHLYEKYNNSIQSENSILNKVVIIELYDDIKFGGGVVKNFIRKLTSTLPYNQVMRRYCGANQEEVFELFSEYVPVIRQGLIMRVN